MRVTGGFTITSCSFARARVTSCQLSVRTQRGPKRALAIRESKTQLHTNGPLEELFWCTADRGIESWCTHVTCGCGAKVG